MTYSQPIGIRDLIIPISMAISGGGAWIAIDLIFQHAQLSDLTYWLWVVVGATIAAKRLRIGGVLFCAALAAVSFLTTPSILVFLGLPADFTGWDGLRVMLWVSLPIFFGIYLLAFVAINGFRRRFGAPKVR